MSVIGRTGVTVAKSMAVSPAMFQLGAAIARPTIFCSPASLKHQSLLSRVEYCSKAREQIRKFVFQKRNRDPGQSEAVLTGDSRCEHGWAFSHWFTAQVSIPARNRSKFPMLVGLKDRDRCDIIEWLLAQLKRDATSPSTAAIERSW